LFVYAWNIGYKRRTKIHAINEKCLRLLCIKIGMITLKMETKNFKKEFLNYKSKGRKFLGDGERDGKTETDDNIIIHRR